MGDDLSCGLLLLYFSGISGCGLRGGFGRHWLLFADTRIAMMMMMGRMESGHTRTRRGVGADIPCDYPSSSFTAWLCRPAIR